MNRPSYVSVIRRAESKKRAILRSNSVNSESQLIEKRIAKLCRKIKNFHNQTKDTHSIFSLDNRQINQHSERYEQYHSDLVLEIITLVSELIPESSSTPEITKKINPLSKEKLDNVMRQCLGIDLKLVSSRSFHKPVSIPSFQENFFMETVPVTHLCYIHGRYVNACRMPFDIALNFLNVSIENAYYDSKNKLVAKCQNIKYEQLCQEEFNIEHVVFSLPKKRSGSDLISSEISEGWNSARSRLIKRLKNKSFRLKKEQCKKEYNKFSPEDCPFPRCAESINGITLVGYGFEIKSCMRTCINCHAYECSMCSGWFKDQDPLKDHAGISCDIMRLILDGQNDAASIRLIESSTKSCPQCQARTEKKDGCNHITCQVCKVHWCWKCQWHSNLISTFIDKEGRSRQMGIYDHMTTAHGTF